MEFSKLIFNSRQDGIQCRMFFLNGYGVSIVRGEYTYGGTEGLYEIAVLNKDGSICYSTPITNDVLGHLSEEEVVNTIEKIKAL